MVGSKCTGAHGNEPMVNVIMLYLQDKTIIETAVIPWYMCILDMGPVVYAGSAVLFLAAFAICLTYVTCHK